MYQKPLKRGVNTEDNLDLEKAQKILDADHFGMKKPKERIIEFLATGNLKKNVTKGKVICFVGPPGVGKTSFGKSIARAIGRKFVSTNLCGVNSVSEIKGHRRTYIGSMPGRIIAQIIKSKTTNPVFMIDEIDKIGHRDGVDTGNSLLDLFDVSNNNEFTDNFIQVPVDLSKVLFICTANDISNISVPLANRIEFIRLSGYISSEKLQIAQKYLVPRVKRDAGLSALDDVEIAPEAIAEICQWYSREPGVRDLERAIQKIVRKIAVKVVKNEQNKTEQQKISYTVGLKEVEEYLGNKKFASERMFQKTPSGVAAGLAYTGQEGGLVYVETQVIGPAAKGERVEYKTTGNIKNVMKESVDIGISVATHFLSKIKKPSAANPNFFRQNSLHIHFPEGAIPKEGPSAGVALLSALTSLATDKPVKENLAMTGEISLTGKVMKIGGLKEKTLGAIRANIKEMIVPKDNESDWNELEDELKSKMKINFVDSAKEVLAIALPDLEFK